jgi:DNA-binding transcriptional regulator YiaG
VLRNPSDPKAFEEMAASGVDNLLERVRSRRKLPMAAERRRIREAAGFSLRDIGAALGVSHTAVASWEAGAMPREQIGRYAALLEALRSELCFGVESDEMRETGFPTSKPRADANVDGHAIS